jgi:hypothetical protein
MKFFQKHGISNEDLLKLRFLNSQVRLLCCEFVDLDTDEVAIFFVFAIAIVK